ncbi:hypothetical protein HU200_051400 [Digitaria exilis]|uniref:Cytochrome P450 n=1 Tax=Digitaria exilis TaxID=1010633 RepID=A0A835E990_9POAL|nr:hypothetical protein HU200_051400 [Digitaria exilis]
MVVLVAGHDTSSVLMTFMISHLAGRRRSSHPPIFRSFPASVTHMDPGIFEDPEKFDPWRFDGPAPPYSFVAFGGGQWLCAGIEFARVETLVTMHHLVSRFRWKLCCKENTFVRDPMPLPLHGLPIELEHIGVASSLGKSAC